VPSAAAPPTPAALVLAAAVYDKDAPFVDLAFDRAIDIDAMDVTQVLVDDDTFTGSRLVGFETPVLVAATTVRVPLNPIDGAMHPDIHLTTTGGTGIVAVDDGGTWAGVSDLALPFP
jgi:hypothetical protein